MTENTEERQRQPGDGCRLIGNYQVQHVDCTDYPAGTITDVRTGEIVRQP